MANPVYNTARTVTQRSGSYSGKGMLTAELLVAFIIVLIRVVADFSVTGDGTAKGNVLHPSGQYGPLPIAAGLIGSFFFLSFLAMGGGTRAKVAVIFGGSIVVALGVKSYSEITKIGSVIGNVGSVVVPPASGSEESGATDTSSLAAPAEGSSSAASSAANAASNTAQQMAGTSGLTPGGIVQDVENAAEQSFRQLIPGGTVPQVEQLGSAVGNKLKSLLGGL